MNMTDVQMSEWRLNRLYDMCPSRVSDSTLRPLTTMANIIILPVRTRSVVVMEEGGTRRRRRLRGVKVRRFMGARIVLWVLIEIEIEILGVRVVVRGTVESVVGRIHLDILNV